MDPAGSRRHVRFVLPNAGPDGTRDLGQALLLTSAAMALSGIFYPWGARSVGDDTRRVLETVRRREKDAQSATDAA